MLHCFLLFCFLLFTLKLFKLFKEQCLDQPPHIDNRKHGTDQDSQCYRPCLLFDRSNWFIPQYVTVRAPRDSYAEGDQEILIQHSVQQGGSADDGGAYDKISIPTVVTQVIDEDTAGVLVIPGAEPTIVAEAGNSESDVAAWGAPIIQESPQLGRVGQLVAEQAKPYRRPGEARNELVPQAAQVLRVAATYDRSVSEHGLTVVEALESLHRGAAYEYDPEVVAALRRVLQHRGVPGA